MSLTPLSAPIAPPTVTIFGGSGFIGRAIVYALAQLPLPPERRVRIRVATRHLASAEFLRSYGAVGQVTPILCNPARPAEVAAAVAGADGVVNCVGILSESRRAKFAALHGELPGLIARAMVAEAKSDARLVHLSAIGADANSPSAYARSKAMGEGLLQALFPQAAILRPSVVFGPGDDFFNRFARLALLSPALPLFGGGATRVQPVFVEDVARAVVNALALGRATAPQGTFELGGPEIYTWRETMRLLLAAIGRQRCLVAVPNALAWPLARLAEFVPGKPFTRDQLKLLQRDNLAGALPGLRELGVAPTAVETVLPTYLDRFRPNGSFNSRRTA